MKKILNKFYIYYLKIKYSNLKIGRNLKLDLKTRIFPWKGSIILGDNVTLKSDPRGYQAGMPFSTCLLTDVEDSKIEIGDNCRLNGVYVHAQKSISIGCNSVIASGVNIIDSNGHQVNSLNRTVGRDEPSKIIIEDNVWIGINSVILKGTKIGKNSVIGACSVVKGEFPSDVILSGNPAIIIGKIKTNIDENSNS